MPSRDPADIAFERDVTAALLPETKRRHPGIRLGSGRAGRPSKIELASFRRYLSQLDFETLEMLGYCECGTPLDIHPPLVASKPLMSDHARQAEARSPRQRPARPTRGQRFEFRPSAKRVREHEPVPEG